MPDNPPIQILFHGLVVLRSPPAAPNWFAEIHHEAADHVLSIEVRLKEPGKPDRVLFRHYGPLDPSLKITVVRQDGSEVAPRAFKYKPSFFPLPPEEAVKNFESVLNLGSPKFHNTLLKVKEPKTRPNIEFSGGDSYLYSALVEKDIEVTPPPKKNEDGTTDDTANPSFKTEVAVIAGAYLYFGAEGVKAVITGGKLTQPLELPKLLASSPITYEIYVNNSPLAEPQTAAHSDVEEHYAIVEKTNGDDLPVTGHFKLKFPNETVAPDTATTGKYLLEDDRASIRIPCMPGTVDG
jgi:hypothetical protein